MRPAASIYPGWFNTHHHLFQSVLKGVQAGINLPLAGWLRSVPYAYWSRHRRGGAGGRGPRSASPSCCCPAPRPWPITTICSADTYRFDPAAVIFEVADAASALRLVLCRGGGDQDEPCRRRRRSTDAG